MKKRKTKYEGLQKHKAISGYLFISPFIIGFLVFMLKPLFQSLYFSFVFVNLQAGTYTTEYIGLENYDYAFRVDPNYVTQLGDELLRMILYSIAIIVFSLFVALILNSEFKGRALVRAVFFLPVIMSSGVILGLEENNTVMAQLADSIEMTASNISISDTIQKILQTADIGTKAWDKVFEIIDNIYDVAVASGIQIIIFLSGLQTISSSLYEAADIDGCTKWESLWKITIPMVSSLFLVNWIYTCIDFCMRSDNQVVKTIQTAMVQKQDYGVSSAMSWIYFVVILAWIGLTSFFISKVVYYNDAEY